MLAQAFESLQCKVSLNKKNSSKIWTKLIIDRPKNFSSFFALIIALVIASTTYEIICNSRGTKVHPMLNAFSVYTNSKIILTMKPLMQNEMIFLHGIRSIAIIWIVWGHAFSIDFWMAPLINSSGLLNQSGHPLAMITFSGYLAVDTFLMLSSMLMSMSVLRELDKT